MTELERLAAEIFAQCEKDGEPVTMKEAEEMASMELKDKGNRRYEKSDVPRKKSTRERKVDREKAFLLNLLYNGLDPSDVEGLKVGPKHNEAEFSFTYGDNSYTVKLIRHRPPKKQAV